MKRKPCLHGVIVSIDLASFPGCNGKRPCKLEFKLLLPLPESWQISELCHMTTVNQIASCVETSQSYYTSHHRNSRLLDSDIVVALHKDFCSFVFYLPYVAEPQAGKDRSHLVEVRIRSITWILCLSEVCNCHVHIQLELRKLPDHFF